MATNTGRRTYDTSTRIRSTWAKDTKDTGRRPVSVARVLQIQANKGARPVPYVESQKMIAMETSLRTSKSAMP